MMLPVCVFYNAFGKEATNSLLCRPKGDFRDLAQKHDGNANENVT